MSSPVPRPAERVLRAWWAAVRRGWEAGVARFGLRRPDAEVFLELVAERLERRVAARRGDRDDLAEDVARRTHWSDLFLAAGCETGEEAAWSILLREILPEVERRARPTQPGRELREIVEALPGDLVRPTLGGAPAIARYDGSGSLVSWLVVQVLRRGVDRTRSRVSRDRAEARDGSRPTAAAPLEQLLAQETRDALDRALAAGWRELSARERFVLTARYRDGRKQNQIAGVLGLSEARLSRIVHAAVAKLRAVVDRVGEIGSTEGGAWLELRDLLADRLASPAAGDDQGDEEGRHP